MSICIVKGASKHHYFLQNLQLLRMSEGDQVTLCYRSRWVDPTLVDCDAFKGQSATVVFCDKPDWKLIPVRQMDVYDAEVAQDTIALHARCGRFVDPDSAHDWSDELRSQNPAAGTDSGLFVFPTSDLGVCVPAEDERQEPAWRSIVRDLASVAQYRRCYFFFSRGITDTDGGKPVAGPLEVGRAYQLGVLSYNKHVDRDVRREAKIHITSDETILATGIDQSVEQGLPDYKDFVILLRPVGPGSTKLELGVLGSYDQTSRIHLHIDTALAGSASVDRVRARGGAAADST